MSGELICARMSDSRTARSPSICCLMDASLPLDRTRAITEQRAKCSVHGRFDEGTHLHTISSAIMCKIKPQAHPA